MLQKAGIDPDAARYVLEYLGDFTPTQLQLHGRDVMPDPIAKAFEAAIPRLLQHEPAQYIIGLAPFYGHDFKVSPAVLIPRFETEELVAWVAEDRAQAQTLLDVGTGSGVIGITLKAQCPQLDVTMMDVSSDALAIAQQNAQRLQVEVTLKQSDLFSAVAGQRFDRIVSNLPYISHKEVDVMDESTLAFEPHLALFADHNGLALFERFCQQLPEHVHAGSQAYLEFGYQQQPALAKLFAEVLPQAQVEFRQDLAGHPRMVKLTF
ncbi:n5-glutamine s-adenosyl-l-methionine-dependent methyltransferase [Lacticaseibacillus manihotivorans DSM 13343 = JCM 12514]|uniref:Release factor glutamine methyltransferase n=1 Tax=Lacticaseibacillus manihotivorans DSM 13343 = JCM 12514 TaxID=1423769 RepID=A0A0R1R9L6_9LACO|nr:n5-glutamine s-adenosyl-l-methionine-dependent methyltransferase [Lacticaseibacillus manihotivorans DSM 13343 = JCM 12514]